MPRALWQLLLEDPSDLTCDECFAVMEYYAETLAGCGDLLPAIVKHLERCPDCALQHRQALHQLVAEQGEGDGASVAGTVERGQSSMVRRKQAGCAATQV